MGKHHPKKRGKSDGEENGGGGAKGGKQSKKKGSFRDFIKKRAPIYLGLTGLFVIFVVPEIMGGSLHGLFPEDLDAEDRRVLDMVMEYSGPDGDGYTVADAVDAKIRDEFSDDRVYRHGSSKVVIGVEETGAQTYELSFRFESGGGGKEARGLDYVWSVDAGSGDIEGMDSPSKAIVDLVDFYD